MLPMFALNIVAIVVLLCVCHNCKANPAALSDDPAAPPTLPERPPLGWTRLTMLLDDGTKEKTVLLRDGAQDAEVYAAIAKGCEEAGVADDQASTIMERWLFQKWGKAENQRMGYQRTGFMFELTGSKDIFQQFLGPLEALAEQRPIIMLETGSWEGASASWVAEHLLQHPRSLLVCLDTWDGGRELENTGYDMTPIEERFHWNMAKTPYGDRVLAFKGDSHESLAGLLARGLTSSFDAIYVDASHEMKDVLGDALLSFRLLKIGGIMIFDDCNMQGVARATATFEEAIGDKLHVLYRDKNHLVVKKAAHDRFAKRDSELVMGDESKLKALADKSIMGKDHMS